MIGSPENPYRSPETEQRPPRSLAMLRRRIFGAVAFSLGVLFALTSLIALIQLAIAKTAPPWQALLLTIAWPGVAFWLIRLGRREWKAGKP
jgi:hypothetical protein